MGHAFTSDNSEERLAAPHLSGVCGGQSAGNQNPRSGCHSIELQNTVFDRIITVCLKEAGHILQRDRAITTELKAVERMLTSPHSRSTDTLRSPLAVVPMASVSTSQGKAMALMVVISLLMLLFFGKLTYYI